MTFGSHAKDPLLQLWVFSRTRRCEQFDAWGDIIYVLADVVWDGISDQISALCFDRLTRE